MKVSTIKKTPEFVPVDLVITFESQKEAEAFFAIFNLVTLTDIYEKFDIDHKKIRNQISSLVNIDTGTTSACWKELHGVTK